MIELRTAERPEANFEKERTAAMEQERTELDMHADRLGRTVERLEELNAQLNRLAERLHGPKTSNPEDNTVPMEPPGVMSLLNYRDGQIARELDDAFEHLRELNGTI